MSLVSRLILGAACALTAAGCGGEMLRTGRSPVFLVVTAVAAANGDTASTYTPFLLSDVRKDDGTVWNDNAKVSLRVDAKNQSVTTTPLNNVTLTRTGLNSSERTARTWGALTSRTVSTVC